MRHEFFNDWHLGDCLWQCQFMRKAAVANSRDEFIFYCNNLYHKQLLPVVRDIPNIQLRPHHERTTRAINCWIATDRYWFSSPLHSDIIAFLCDWYAEVARRTGIAPVMNHREDWLMDYAALHLTADPERKATGVPCEWLVVNSRAHSGQFHYDDSIMDSIIQGLMSKGTVMVTNRCGVPGVVSTEELGWSITDIGIQSTRCNNILAVATGPIWPTFNVLNHNPMMRRITLLNNLRLNYGIEHPHFNSMPEVLTWMKTQSII